ncbi:hypothetical protein CC2G_011306 [Coprinopsis cinerea AmutBmut pab1-1]|nr:hypothetical protein CC2G_011306 [Coprinopsis cinerea AmutBmut pab1-1]
MILAQLAVVVLPLVASAAAVCDGYNFAIGNVQRVGGGLNRWNVYNKCQVLDGLTTSKNPCNAGIFGCSPSPIFFNKYYTRLPGAPYPYACRRDPKSEKCGSDVISVCCGKK